jgi:hypothetical protein
LPLKSWLWGQMGFMNGLGLGYPKSGATPSTWGTHTWGELVRTTIFILGPGMGYQATRPTRSLGDAWYRCWDYQSRWDCTPCFLEYIQQTVYADHDPILAEWIYHYWNQSALKPWRARLNLAGLGNEVRRSPYRTNISVINMK